MNDLSTFNIYDASAGSGKTFTLVKEYLKKALASNSISSYQNILAITFTNKAVTEMKTRIIKNLIDFSHENSVENPSEMLTIIASELKQSPQVLQNKSKNILDHLLHNYAGFNVDTIDRFNHQILRTFAKDLNLSSSFEVSLDTDRIILEAVERLISKTGEQPKITQVLLDFSVLKVDDDRSWDITYDIVKAAKIISAETDAIYLDQLNDRTLDDFLNYKAELNKLKRLRQKDAKLIAAETLTMIDEAGLEHSDFSNSSFPNYLIKISKGEIPSFDVKWQLNFGEKNLYPTRVSKNSPEIATTIEDLTPYFVDQFNASKKLVNQFLLYQNLLNNLTPLMVINLVKKEIEEIKKEQDVLPIFEFNKLIHKEIIDQPAPFIYERLGEKYQHFFIDEFQDTSLFQWENLVPLISNAISQQDSNEEKGSLLIVGDIKQAIYRWRGGLPEQFLNLINGKNPFSQAATITSLPINFRSNETIVDFNNRFFNHASGYLTDEAYQKLYKDGSKQEIKHRQDGYIKIEFINKDEDATLGDIYNEKIHQTVQNLLINGYDYNDICILTRKNDQGVIISEYLLSNNIPVISQETLLLKHSAIVNCLVNVFIYTTNPEDQQAKIELFDFIHDHLEINIEKYIFLSALKEANVEQVSKELLKFGVVIDFNIIDTLSLYESCEYIIRSLKLEGLADAYLYGFLDLVYDYELKPKADKVGFLDVWYVKRDKAAIATSSNLNAVQIMTIHKAKGLEFPVVIFPYAESEIYNYKDQNTWIPFSTADSTFQSARMKIKKEIINYNEESEAVYADFRSTQLLDSINLLYVTLTRAKSQFYVLAETPDEIKNDGPTKMSQLFKSFLEFDSKWNSEKLIYEYGTFQSRSDSRDSGPHQIVTPSYYSLTPNDHNLNFATAEALLWETEVENALSLGNMIHLVMAEIISEEDVNSVFSDLRSRGLYSEEQIEIITTTVNNIINHPELNKFYKESCEVRNEEDILMPSGEILRPDRINFLGENRVVIIDYKTGKHTNKNESQILGYAEVLTAMGFEVQDKFLVYTNDQEISINKL